jgi:hypothetical protein
MAKPRNSRAKYQRARNSSQRNDMTASAAAGIAARPAKVAASGVQTMTDDSRYKYITADLRNISILAGALIIILIVLTFFIR